MATSTIHRFRPSAWYYLTVATATLGGSFQFYSMNVLNPLQLFVTSWINETYSERRSTDNMTDSGLSKVSLSLYWSSISSGAVVGGLLGSILIRFAAEKLGRRNAIIANSAINIIGIALCAFAKSSRAPEMLLVGRLFVGMSVGVISGVVPMYLTEISRTDNRGFAGAVHMCAIAFGDLCSLLLGLPFIFGTDELWPLAVALPGVLTLVMICILPFCPESPRYLLRRDQPVRAKRSLQKLINRREDLNETMTLLQLDEEVSLSQTPYLVAIMTSGSQQWSSAETSGAVSQSSNVPDSSQSETLYSTLCQMWEQRAIRRALLLSIAVMVGQQFTGNVAVFMYSTQIFTQAGLPNSTAQLSTGLIGSAYFMSVLLSLYLIERWGRKPLFVVQLACCATTLSLLSISVALTDRGCTITRQISVALLFIFMAGYGIGCSIPWLITSELFEMRYRSTAVTISILVSFSLSVLNAFLYPPFQQLVGMCYSLIPYIVVSAAGVYVHLKYLPETKNRSIHEVIESFFVRERQKHDYERMD